MPTDALVAFYCGIGVGIVLGIVISAILKVIADTIEKGGAE